MSSPHTLLIVEDNPEFISYLKRLIGRIDVKLITANRGQTAIQCLNKGNVDLVLLDIGLPDIDGYQLMDHILKELPETLFIAMTGEVSVESAVKALRNGAYDYLRKPFESTEMIKTVENALDRLKLERQHKQTEEALRKSEQQLLVKNKMLSLGRVAAGIAHEIRNPLTGINTYLYTIEDLCNSDQLEPDEMETIQQIITQIQVADSGPGVPVELREKIFDPFFTTKDDGSGIGLNIAQRIVADHSGTLSLDSSKLGGVEFQIELPIERRTNA